MGLVIRKRISLDFLGEEYKDAYLVFRAIPVNDLSEIQKGLPSQEDGDNTQAIPVMLNVIKKYFLNGQAPGESGELEQVNVEDLDLIDANTAIHCFQGLSGVEGNLEPDSESSSSPSTQTELAEPNLQ